MILKGKFQSQTTQSNGRLNPSFFNWIL